MSEDYSEKNMWHKYREKKPTVARPPKVPLEDIVVIVKEVRKVSKNEG